MISYTEYNAAIIDWCQQTVRLLKAEAVSLGVYKTGTFAGSINYKVRVDSLSGGQKWQSNAVSISGEDGRISVVGFAFAKYGIYVHYGLAGRGGKTRVGEKHWYTNVMDKQLDDLQELALDKEAKAINDGLFKQLTVGLIYE
jgi:hypothetical protein